MSRKASKSLASQNPPRHPTAPPSVLRLPKISPKHALQLLPLYPQLNPTIFEIPDLLSTAECQALLSTLPAAHPLERVAHAATRRIAWRDVERVEFQASELSHALWAAGLSSAMAQVPLPPHLSWAGLNSKWRIYRYGRDQGFGPHYDEVDTDALTGLHSHFTLLVYLSEVKAGGETVFYEGRGKLAAAVQPRVGLALVHAQGGQCMLHEGRPVGPGGDKWVLRSDVMVREE